MKRALKAILVAAAFVLPMGGNSAMADATGWTFVTENDPQAQLVHLRVVIRSGSLSDPANLPGLANFTARALLRGTQTRPFKDLSNAIERLGGTMSIAADETKTVLSGAVLASNFDSYLDLLKDVLTQPAFASTEMTTLQAILLGEIRARYQDPREVAARALLQAAYAGTSLQAPPAGTLDAVSRATPQDLAAFFRAHYNRQNMVIGVTSPFADADVAQRLAAKLGGVPQGALDGPQLPASQLPGRRAVIVDRKGMATTPLFIAVPGIGDGDSDWLALDVGNFVFGEDFTSRLMQVLRAQHGWTYGAYSGYNQLLAPSQGAGLFSLYAFPSVDSINLSIPAALSMLDAYAKSGISPDELAAAIDAKGNRYPFSLATAEQRLELRLRQLLSGRPYLSAADYRQRLGALTLTVAGATIEHRVSTTNLLLAAVGDASALKPVLLNLPLIDSVTVVDVQP